MNEELKKRVDAFQEGYKKLVDEHKIDYASFPVFMPDGEGAFKVFVNSVPVDVKDKPVPSPFIAQDVKEN